MKKISFEIPSLYYDEQGKLILKRLCEALQGKKRKKRKHGNKK